MAGAGLSVGPQAGSLLAAFAPVLPRRIGLSGADAPSTARADAISIVYVPVTLSQTTTSTVVPDPGGLAVEAAPNCPIGQPVCGLRAGTAIVVFDDSGRHDVFSVTGILNNAAEIQPHARSLPYAYPAGAHVAQVEARSIYFDGTASELRQYDGYQTDVPIADNVVGLAFEYFGDPEPPRRPKPPVGEENCLYDTAGKLKGSFVPSGSPGELVALPLSMLSDGPWCGSGDTMFDADLLRVRTVRVSIRIQASLAAFRSTGPAFVRPGTNRSSTTALPDLVAARRISPPNLGVGR
jgi:hypothetical protein